MGRSKKDALIEDANWNEVAEKFNQRVEIMNAMKTSGKPIKPVKPKAAQALFIRGMKKLKRALAEDREAVAIFKQALAEKECNGSKWERFERKAIQ